MPSARSKERRAVYAVDRDHALDGAREALRPGDEAVLKALRVERAEDEAELIVTRRAVGEGQEGAFPVFRHSAIVCRRRQAQLNRVFPLQSLPIDPLQPRIVAAQRAIDYVVHRFAETGLIKSHAQCQRAKHFDIRPRLAQRRFILLELLVERQIAAPELLHEDVVDNACSLNQLDQRFLVSFGKACSVHLERCRRKARRHALQFVKTRGWGRCGGFLGNARGHKN